MGVWRTVGLAWLGLGAVVGAVFVALNVLGSEPIPIEGRFVLVDEFTGPPGESCSGDGGYGDINSLTPVIVSDIRGEVIARTALGPGRLVSGAEYAEIDTSYNLDDDSDVGGVFLEALFETTGRPCLFHWTIEVDEGSDGGDGYVVAIGDRGEVYATEEELQDPLTLDLQLGEMLAE